MTHPQTGKTDQNRSKPRARNRRHALRQAFVATVATVGALSGIACDNQQISINPPFAECPTQEPASGESCGGSEGVTCNYGQDFCGFELDYTCTDGAWVHLAGGTCNPPPPEQCPTDAPNYGDACFEVGLTCFYEDPFCGEFEATCTADGWESFAGTCNPPPAECPNDMPAEGTICEEQPDSWDLYPSYCQYEVETPCGTQPIALGCEPNENSLETEWVIQTPPTCEAQPSGCQSYEDHGACNADATCAWRVPGCDDGQIAPLVEEGCYPVDDCAAAGCGDWGTCTKVSHDPCAFSNCASCAAELNVCIPNATL